MASRTNRLNIHLIKTGVKAKDALVDPNVLTKVAATAGGATVGDLYIYKMKAHPPGWAALFPEQGAELRKLLSAGSGAVLFVKKKERTFALTFGYASHHLRASAIEEGFGLKVTLNSVPGNHLRSVDAFTPDVIGRRTKVQASRMGAIPDFGVNIDQDLLRAATGVPSDQALAKRARWRR